MAKKKIEEKKVTIVDRTIKNFFDKEYFNYAKYVLESRALPSLVDGLKPGARKIINAAFSILSENKGSNFMDLVGSTMSVSKYHHGNSSIESTILTLGSYFSNNLNPLLIDGTGGSLRSDEAAAPRYLGVILSKYSKLLKHNENILEYNYDGDDKVEPKHYLPIIPLILANRTSGIAIGYSFTNSISFHPVSLVEGCIEYLKNKTLKNHLVPHINEYSGTFHNIIDHRIYCKGKYSIDWKKNVVEINEFSPFMTYAKFEDALIKLEEVKKYIIKWENLSEEDEIKYKIYFTKEKLESLVKSKKLELTLNISSYFDNSNLTMLDENNKLIEFSNHEDVLKYFVDYRLEKYEILKNVILEDIKSNIDESEILRKFIDLYLKGDIKFSKDISIEDTIKSIKSFKLPEYLIETKLSKLTKDEYDKLGLKIKELNSEFDKISKTDPKELYLDDLEKLKLSIVKDFKKYEMETITKDELNKKIS